MHMSIKATWSLLFNLRMTTTNIDKTLIINNNYSLPMLKSTLGKNSLHQTLCNDGIISHNLINYF